MAIAKKTYNFPLVNFLSGNNTLLIENEKEFNQLYSLLEKINMEGILGGETYSEWIHIAKINNCSVKPLILEYKNHKGMSMWHNLQESKDWYDEDPIKLKDIISPDYD